jgi:diguanylate cyclase (GGDEF)-like protein
MEYQDLLFFLQHVGTDPSRLIFEDELTGIYNRRFLHNYFRYKVSWDSLEIHPVSLIMMDLDHFKQVNDTYGHGIGDQVLIWLASLLKEMSGDKGLAIRYAGDEFMILMPHTDKDAALQLGQNLIQRLHKESLHLPEMEGELHITLSVGVATAPEDARTGIRQKDRARSTSQRRTGRSRRCICQDSSPTIGPCDNRRPQDPARQDS